MRRQRQAVLMLSLAIVVQAKADPLALDGWSDQRWRAVQAWLFSEADAVRPCSQHVRTAVPHGVTLLASRCTASREGGKVVARERTLTVSIAGARWKGHTISTLGYEQQYDVGQGFVVHTAMSFELPRGGDAALARLNARWRERGTNPYRDSTDTRDLVDIEAGLESVQRIGDKLIYKTEFFE